MIRKRLFRTALASAFTLGLLSAPMIAVAATPNWSPVSSVGLPSQIKFGSTAGFAATIHNDGPSNISQLYADVSYNQTILGGELKYSAAFIKGAAATDPYVEVAGACTPGNVPLCDLGALRSGETARVIVAYTAPSLTPTPSVHVVWSTTGLGSTQCQDTGDNSHGDCLEQDATVTFNSSGDFNGGFSLTDIASYNTSDPAGPNDLFAAGVKGSNLKYIPITVQDDAAYSGCPTGATCFGTSTDNAVLLNVGDGIVFTTPFTVTVNIYKDAVPAGTNAKKLVVVHYYDPDKPHYDTDGNQVFYELISDSCPKTPTSACRDVSWDGKTGIYTVVLKLFENGAVKFF